LLERFRIAVIVLWVLVQTLVLGVAGVHAANLPPVANFTFSPQRPTVRDLVAFADHSTDPDGSVVSWLWFFGDGSSSTAQSPNHVYTSKGRYPINMVIADNDGATDTAVGFIDVVNLPPDANFSFSPRRPTIRDEVVFNDTSIDPDGPVVSWLWLFGDGSNSTLKDPVHRYSRRGQYRVSLQVVDEDGSSAVAEKPVEIVNMPPWANFSHSPEEVVRRSDVLFTDLSRDADGSVVSWLWDFGDNSTSNAPNPKHRYDALGVFVINLTVFDDEGMAGSSSRLVIITNSPPEANFSFSPARPTVNEQVAFVDSSIDVDGSIVSWLWMFGDGAISSARDPRHTYGGRGYYAVILNVTDSDGSQANFTGYVPVIGLPPQADFSFSPSRPTTEDQIAFTDSSRDVDSGIFRWLWDFGDNSTSGLKSTTHTYEKKGRYNVNLTIWDDDGLRASVVKVVDVRARGTVLAWVVVLLPIGALAFALILTWERKRKGTAQGSGSTPRVARR